MMAHAMTNYCNSYNQLADLETPKLHEKDMFKWGGSSESNKKVVQRIRSLRSNGFCIQEERGIPIPESEVRRFHEFMSGLYSEASSFEKS